MAQETIRVEGLRETVRSLEKLGTEAADLKQAFKTIGNIVVGEAQGLTPKLSGALAGSIKASNTKNKSDVRAGGAKVPYAGVIHYGWPGHGIEPNPFLTTAAGNKQREVVNTLDDELGGLIKRLDLN